MRLGETVVIMVQGGRALPEEVLRITQAINRFRPPDQQLDETVVTAIELMAAVEQLDPAIKEVVKNINIETVEDSAMGGPPGGGYHFQSKGLSEQTNLVITIILLLVMSINAVALYYTKQDSEIARMILHAFVEIVKAFVGSDAPTY